MEVLIERKPGDVRLLDEVIAAARCRFPPVQSRPGSTRDSLGRRWLAA